jgi:hypothetical protein
LIPAAADCCAAGEFRAFAELAAPLGAAFVGAELPPTFAFWPSLGIVVNKLEGGTAMVVVTMLRGWPLAVSFPGSLAFCGAA